MPSDETTSLAAERTAGEAAFAALRTKTVGIVGLGLIGSSVAHALRERSLVARVVGTDGSADVRETAAEIGFCDEILASAPEVAAISDVVFLCVPVGACGTVVADLAPGLRAGTILTDVGSVKAAVIQDIRAACPDGVIFIPGHPIAGTEKSGPTAGFASLFQGRWTILTPTGHGDDAEATELVRAIWEGMGAFVDTMTPEHHDLVCAITSHVPHLIAYNIVGTADDLESVTQSEVIKYSAAGFRDFTRIAASDPTMWRDIFLNNREAVLEILGRFSEDLSALQRAIRWGNGDHLHALFTRTRKIRRGIIDAGQETDAVDFGRNTAEHRIRPIPRPYEADES